MVVTGARVGADGDLARLAFTASNSSSMVLYGLVLLTPITTSLKANDPIGVKLSRLKLAFLLGSRYRPKIDGMLV